MAEPQFFNIINDELRGSENTTTVTNPRTEEDLWPCPVATTQDFEDAVAAAHAAFPSWSQTTVPERQAALVKLADVLRDNRDELASILSLETGKSAILANIDITNSIAQTLYYSTHALSDQIQHEDATTRVLATHHPLGLVAALCPWNFPLILASIKVVSALVTGNCVLVKPSPFTPYAVLRWVQLSRGVLPPGVLQALHGGADLGAAITAHPGVAKVSFTGTIATGKKVMAACAATLKRVTLELAGNDACVVCEDADLEVAVPGVAAGAFFNAGQVCVASKRVYVHEGIYEEFLRRLVEEVRGKYTVVEDAGMPSVFGPVDNKVQYEVVKGIVKDCKARGYEIVTGGGVGVGKGGRGYWIEPTIVRKPDEGSLLVQEEQFGPILPVLSWSDEDDVIRRSNLANAGLGASVYSRDLARAERIARRLEAGGVWINQFEKPNHAAFFGGIKDSGYGGEMGQQGLLSYVYTKSLHFTK
ncbi:Aldehyde/histidinol dehydrogenase [Schizothecium vesticola]|uniref:aldehyde dehydrogenase (NAD(+)) n=1 Tax=Schizothecium vesticola TaxID=314040 RepID=A0AA40EK17_9PEZI|nr:Aldehyde/histidinol dehydrogenase [Schizothecium vesticola]